MEIECNQVWRNDQYDELFEELNEKFKDLGMEIPKRDLKKLPEEYTLSKIVFDPAEALPFYQSMENPGWTVACIHLEWFTLELEYSKFKELRELSIKEYEQETTEDESSKGEGL